VVRIRYYGGNVCWSRRLACVRNAEEMSLPVLKSGVSKRRGVGRLRWITRALLRTAMKEVIRDEYNGRVDIIPFNLRWSNSL
jgi:hypothetical protein